MCCNTAPVIAEEAVCSLVCVVFLSCFVCPAHTLFGFSNGRALSFLQKGYNGIGVPDIPHSKVSGALTQKSPVSSSAWKSVWMPSLTAELFLGEETVLKNWRVTRLEGVVARGNLVCCWLWPHLVIGKS